MSKANKRKWEIEDLTETIVELLAWLVAVGVAMVCALKIKASLGL